MPTFVEEQLPESINIQSSLVKNPNTTLIIKVSGDSMVDVGIQPGDRVLVDKVVPFKTGDTVVAMIENEFTVKLLMQNGRGYFLRAANKEKQYPDIHPSVERNVVGKVVSSFRTYD